MLKQDLVPVALTIAGSDSGGGAGIQADLKTFASLGVHGASAIACLTAQNPRRILGIEPVSPKMLRLQLQAVFEELPPAAMKTGMLFSAENVRIVTEFFERISSPSPRPSGERILRKPFRALNPCNLQMRKSLIIKEAILRFMGRVGVRGFEFEGTSASSPRPSPPLGRRGRIVPPPLVVDPVLVSTSGARLLEPAAIKILKEKLLPLAALVTPNLDEAKTLTGHRPASVEEMREAAREIHSRFGCAALVKGGHLNHSREAVDIFFDGKNELLLTAPFVKGVRTHGTGCTYSAAICAALALGHDLPRSVEIGKNFVTAAISGSYRIGKHFALGIF